MTHTSTEQPELLPCPFCGKKPTLTKHHKEDAWGLTHRCEVIGPVSFSWGSRELHIERWNRRTPASKAQRVPLDAEAVQEIMKGAGYSVWDMKSRADFINGIRHGEAAHGITQEKQG